MAQIKLESELRAGTGKGVARKLRVQGRVPGVVYGPSVEPILIGMDEKTLLTHLQKKGMNQIIELEVKNGSASDTHLCLIKEVQRDVYQQHILHIDFRRIDLKEKVVVNIRVNLEGQAAIKAKGGIIEQMVRAIKVRTEPTNIPDSVTTDISGLRLGQTTTIGELPLPEGVELVDNPDAPILNIFAARGSAMASQN